MLRKIKAPVVLIEIGFIDSTGDNNLFGSKRIEYKVLIEPVANDLYVM